MERGEMGRPEIYFLSVFSIYNWTIFPKMTIITLCFFWACRRLKSEFVLWKENSHSLTIVFQIIKENAFQQTAH